MVESLVWIIIVAIVIGALLWIINAHAPIPSQIKQIINVIAWVAILIWALLTLVRFLPH